MIVVNAEPLRLAIGSTADIAVAVLSLVDLVVLVGSDAIGLLDALRPRTLGRGAFPRPMVGGASRARVRRGAPRLDPLGFAVLADRFSHSNSDDRQRNQQAGADTAGEGDHDRDKRQEGEKQALAGLALPACLFRALQERSSRYCEDDVGGDERGDTECHACCNDHLVLLYPSRIRLRSTGIWIAFDPSGNARPDLFLTTDTFMTSP